MKKETLIGIAVASAGFAAALKMEAMYFEIQHLKTALSYQVQITKLETELTESKKRPTVVGYIDPNATTVALNNPDNKKKTLKLPPLPPELTQPPR